MAVTFHDSGALDSVGRPIWYRLFAGRRWWHNRVFSSEQSIERTDDGFLVNWRGRGRVVARRIDRLRPGGSRAVILASGPSVALLEQPERLFQMPVACVNGSVSLPSRLGMRCAYLIVSDARFVRDRPDLFRTGAGLADALVLDPTTLFAAMQFASDALERTHVFLVDNALHPFKRPRPSRAALAADRRLLVHPSRRIAFSLDPSAGVCSAGTVVYNAVQILFGIGYSELFVFGMDLSEGSRFYAEGKPAANELARAFDGSIEPGFELVAEYLRRTGRKLVNASANSRLPGTCIPKVDGNAVLDSQAKGQSLTPSQFPCRAHERVGQLSAWCVGGTGEAPTNIRLTCPP